MYAHLQDCFGAHARELPPSLNPATLLGGDPLRHDCVEAVQSRELCLQRLHFPERRREFRLDGCSVSGNRRTHPDGALARLDERQWPGIGHLTERLETGLWNWALERSHRRRALLPNDESYDTHAKQCAAQAEDTCRNVYEADGQRHSLSTAITTIAGRRLSWRWHARRWRRQRGRCWRWRWRRR